MVRLLKWMIFSQLIVVLGVSFSSAAAQTSMPTPAPIAEAGLPVISTTNASQLTLLGSLNTLKFHGFSPDSKQLFYVDFDRKTQAWDITAGKTVVTLNTTGSYGVLSSDAKTLTNINGDSVETWDTTTGQPSGTVKLDNVPQGAALSFSSTAKFVGMMDIASGNYSLWDASSGKSLFTIQFGAKSTGYLLFTPDDKAVLLYNAAGDMQFVDTMSGSVLWKLHSDVLSDPYGSTLLLSPDGKVLAIIGAFGAAQLVDTASGKVEASIQGFPNGDHSTIKSAFSQDSKILTVRLDNGVTSYDLTGKIQTTAQADSDQLMSLHPLVFSPDGTLEARQPAPNVVEIVDVAASKVVDTITAGTDQVVGGASFSPDGKLLALNVDSTIELWGVGA